MPIEPILLLIMITTFVIGTVSSINIGVVAMVAAFTAGPLLLGMNTNDIIQAMPQTTFILIFGIMFLIGVANLNGTTDWLVDQLIKLTRGNVSVMPWALFFVGLIASSVGAVVAPILFFIGLSFAARYQVSPLLMGAMALHGNQAGLFSPVAPYGVLFSELSANQGFSVDSNMLYVWVLLAHIALAIVISFAIKNKTLAPLEQDQAIEDQSQTSGELTPQIIATLFGFVIWILSVMIFKANVGTSALTVGVCLLLLAPGKQRKEVLNEVPWSVLMIICGVIMLVAVMQEANTFIWFAEQARALGSPLLIALVMCFIAAAVTAVSSTFGTFSVLVPMLAPFILSGDISGTMVIAAISFSAAVTDISPFSPWGALYLSMAKQFDQNSLLRITLIYALQLILIAPIVAWLAFIVIPG